MTDPQPRTLQRSPALAGLYAKAALPLLPGVRRLARTTVASDGTTLPGLRLALHDVKTDSDRLDVYRRVCGFPVKDLLPATYLHLLAFPLHLALMTEPDFPFIAMGTVHISNRIEHRRPVGTGERVGVAVWAERLAPHHRGRTVTLVSEADVDAEIVWREETVLLSRGPGRVDATEANLDLPGDLPTGPCRWSLPSNLGRRYAAVSGDRNPIHLYDVTAKPFGFHRHIAHGMWTKARCLAELDNRLADSFVVSVAFRRPVELPGAVTFGARLSADQLDFGVHSGSARTHLLGRVRQA